MADSKRITMKDVAREAGVALGTVSKVVNGVPVGKSYRTFLSGASPIYYHQQRHVSISRACICTFFSPHFP